MLSYNHALFIKQAIDSVVAQSYRNWELIIVDDGSEDNSMEIARAYAAKFADRVQLITHPGGSNLGIGASYALGLKKARGEFIGFLESDDIWSERNAEEKIGFLKREDVGLVYSDFELIGDPDTIRDRSVRLRGFPRAAAYVPFNGLPLIFMLNFVLTFSAMIVKAQALKKIKFAEREFDVCQDMFVLLQVSLENKFFFIPRKLIFWRQHGASFWNKNFLKLDGLNILRFEMRMRAMFLREMIHMNRGNCFRAIEIVFFFLAGLCRRFFLYLANKLPFGLKQNT